MVDMDLNLTLPDCSTHNISAVSANWIMTDARFMRMASSQDLEVIIWSFDNYTLTSDYSDYVIFERKKFRI